MYKNISLIALASSLFAGCTSVPMESKEHSDRAKEFNPPSAGTAGLYIYRTGSFGGSLKRDIWLDDKCVGKTAPNVFFYEQVEGGKEHKVSTESEFSPNDLRINTKSGQNYFIKQYIKPGAFAGGANVKLVDEIEGKKAVQGLDMAKRGSCGR